MALTALPNQRSTETVGTWMWRECTLSTTSVTDVIFEVEKHVVILDFVIIKLTAGAATALTCDVKVANSGGDVTLESALDLEFAAADAYVYDRATAPGTITNAQPTNIELDITANTVTTAARVLIGVLCARVEYEPDATL